MKKYLSFLLPLVLCLALLLTPVRGAGESVTINGGAASFGAAQPYTQDGTLMLPVDTLLDTLGCAMKQDGGAYVITRGSREVRLVPGEKRIIVGGDYVAVQAAPAVQGGTLCAPAAELLSALGVSYTLSGGALAISTGADSAYVLGLEKAAGAGNFWKVYNDAEAAREAGSYALAVEGYEKVVPNFLKENDNYLGAALDFGKLAECYARLGQYGRAAAAYSRSAYYWRLNGSDRETALGMQTKAELLTEEISLYLKTSDLSLSPETTHGVSYEPARGIVLGYTDDESKSYEKTSAKQPGMWLQYFVYGDDLTSADNAYILENARKYVVELAVEPRSGLASVNDETTKQLALAIKNSGGKFMIRFASEMNDATSLWYTTDTASFRQAYIKFAKVMRQYAPDVPLIWSPNFYPSDTAASYYPGDEYVDYVGVSSYFFSKFYDQQEIDWGYDLLGTGVKNERWSQQIDFLYHLYACKKPLMVSEGAASYIDNKSNANITAYAADAIRDFYTYLPMRYPNLKYAVYFNVNTLTKPTRFRLSDDARLANAYNAAIADGSYLSSYSAAPSESTCYVSFDRLGPTKTIPAAKQQLCAYVKEPDDSRVASVRYELDGVRLGDVSAIPYAISCDFSGYAGKVVTVTVSPLDSAGNVLSSASFQAKVAGSAPTPATAPASAPASIGVTVNGSAVTWTDAAPFIDANNRTMVPLRAVGDALGLKVEWDNAAREASFSDGSKTLYFPIDSNTARTNDGKSIPMDTAAVIVNSRTYAPVRYLAEFFGHTVTWDNASRTVVIQ